MVAQQAGATTHAQILLSGLVPPLAEHYHPRQETGPGLTAGLRQGQVIVLTDGTQAAQGGTGKTQLAVEFAHALWNTRGVEVLVWVTAASREAILTGFAQASAMVGGSDPVTVPGAAAAAAGFVGWLAHTDKQWALIIDDLARTSDLDGLWPTGPAGQVVITTRLPGEALSAAADRDLAVVPVGGFSRREALGYLNARLTDFPDQRIEALDLGEDLEGLPLAVTQAAEVMVIRELDCRQYRAQLAGRRASMSDRFVDGVSSSVLATWSLAAECAHDLPPAGLAWPALALAAMLDPHGIPGAVLTSATACGYITGRPSTASGVDQNLVRRAIGNLARVGLVTIDPGTPVRTVRMHPAVQASVRAYIPAVELEQVVLAAADALVETWPDDDGSAQLDQAMRDCGFALRGFQDGILWKPEAHPLLFRAGLSLDGSRLAESAIGYWQSMLSTSARLLGPAHSNSVMARDRLAIAYESAGRIADAIAVFASALADRERNLGPEHPDTIAARGRLAHAYASAGRSEALAMYERTVADSDRQLGPGHPGTLSARAGLTGAYQAAGRSMDAIRSGQLLVTDAERLLGASHATALAARASLADAYQTAGQAQQAIEQYQHVLSAQEAIRGSDHLEAINARAGLAAALRQAGRFKDASTQYERVLADCERCLGADHPLTRTVRDNFKAAAT